MGRNLKTVGMSEGRVFFSSWRGPVAALLGTLLIAGPTIAADKNLHDRLTRLKTIPGNDNRTLVDSTRYPWRAVGRLNRRTGGHCTATVVAPKLVLTAAHCLWNPRTQRFLPAVSVHFVAGWQKGDYLFHAKAMKIEIAPRYDPAKAKTSAGFARDWALVTLADDPAPVTGIIAPIALAPLLGDAGTFTQAGYSADKRHILSAHQGCRIKGLTQGKALAVHVCDALPGDSGSPIVQRSGEGRYHLVAVLP